MKRAFVFIPVALTLAVSACETNRNAIPLGRDFGDATSHNFSQHIVNPEPVTAGYGAPALNGERATSAIERYETGSVIAPDEESVGN